eukprot:197971-Amorphochlora_amoeboformis.AAC.1
MSSEPRPAQCRWWSEINAAKKRARPKIDVKDWSKDGLAEIVDLKLLLKRGRIEPLWFAFRPDPFVLSSSVCPLSSLFSTFSCFAASFALELPQKFREHPIYVRMLSHALATPVIISNV